jgi:hypothetical protein
MLIKTRKILNSREEDVIQQPLAKDGYSNDRFDKLYAHKTKNPFHGTERDRRGRKTQVSLESPAESKCPRCGAEKFEGMKYCFKCLD